MGSYVLTQECDAVVLGELGSEDTPHRVDHGDRVVATDRLIPEVFIRTGCDLGQQCSARSQAGLRVADAPCGFDRFATLGFDGLIHRIELGLIDACRDERLAQVDHGVTFLIQLRDHFRGAVNALVVGIGVAAQAVHTHHADAGPT